MGRNVCALRTVAALVCALVCFAAEARAQDKGTLNPSPLPPLRNPSDPNTPAKELFGRETQPASMPARSIGFYARGCLAGAAAMPIDGPAWQVMRLSRNRNWGHPRLISFLERFAKAVPGVNGWPGLMIGDISQPRGGPMITGHASHQIGLDADIWLTPMPSRTLSPAERETMMATNLVSADQTHVEPSLWTPAHLALIHAAAQDSMVERIFVHPAIKQELCRAAGSDKAWLSKVRPMYGHNYHFHVRMKCPPGEGTCDPQEPPTAGDGCGEEVRRWIALVTAPPGPVHPKPPLTLAGLPAECRRVLTAE